MYENLRGKSCVRFTAELASSAPVPGGGSVTALLGALSASLCAMAANISRGKAKEPAVGEALRNATERAEALRRELLKLIDADAKAFLRISPGGSGGGTASGSSGQSLRGDRMG